MSGPEVDATILSLLRGPAPCPICGSALPEWCDHRKRASDRFVVQGLDGPECGDCGAVIDLRVAHSCAEASDRRAREAAEFARDAADYSPWDHTDAYADGERAGRDKEARSIVSWLRLVASGRKLSATSAHALRDLAARIERGEHR